MPSAKPTCRIIVCGFTAHILLAQLDLSGFDVGAEVLIRASRIQGSIKLDDSHWTRWLDLSGSVLTGDLTADSMRTEGSLFLRSARVNGEVILRSAKVDGQIDMSGASVAKALNANNLSVGGDLYLRDGAKFDGDVDLSGAKVGGQINMIGASFAKTLNGENLSVGPLYMYGQAIFLGSVNLRNAKINGGLYLNGAIATSLDFTNAVIASELNIADLGWRCTTAATPMDWQLGGPARPYTTCDKRDGTAWLVLRNLQVSTLQDSSNAWPPLLDLEGFHYERLGGLLGGSGPRDMRNRTPEQWAEWLARDPTFSTQPYVQLASVLLATGHRDSAERIQYAGRERERQEDRRRGDWVQWAWLTGLWAVAGYGIGLYTFRVVWWVLGLTVLGAVILWWSPTARRHGPLWLLGASLHRLLPVVELNKEFQEFFDNPAPAHIYEPRNLNRFQMAFFSGLAIVGGILGGILLAALGGLMPKS
jgi:hypothetical protein